MKLFRTIATSVVGVTLTATTALAGSGLVLSAPASAATCPSGAWSDTTVGRPPSAQLGMDGAAIWRSSSTTNNFHVRVSEPGADRVVFWGSVSTDGVLVYKGAHLEGGDFTLSRSPHRFVYRFTNFGAVDGFDVGVLCASYVKISVHEGTSWLPLDHIVMGSSDTHPTANPVTLTKA